MRNKTPYETYLLVAILIILSLGAIYGGITLIYDSSGAGLHLRIDEYLNYPFKDFLLPGILLFVLFGIIPLLLIYPLLAKPKMPWANVFNIYRKRHWAWTYSLFLGIILVIWTDTQIWMMGYYRSMQVFYSLYGLIIIIVCLLPNQMRFFSKTHAHHSSKPENHEPY
jgi:hypothetical protein